MSVKGEGDNPSTSRGLLSLHNTYVERNREYRSYNSSVSPSNSGGLYSKVGVRMSCWISKESQLNLDGMPGQGSCGTFASLKDVELGQLAAPRLDKEPSRCNSLPLEQGGSLV